MINFRKLIDNEEDYKLIYNWCSKKEVYEWFEQRILSYEEIVNKYKEKIKHQEVLIIEYDNISIGLIQIYRYDKKIDNYNNIYEYDLFIGEEKYLNKGIGKDIINKINEYIFFKLHADLIVLRPFKRNERAINCYKKVGFKEYGRRRESEFLNGKYYDLVYMDILDSEFNGTFIKNKNI
jgi:RimJ/RimL family protein N-acetyltransferase